MNKRKITGKTKAKYERVIDEWFVNGFNGTAAYRKFYKNIKTDSTATVNFSQIQALPEMVEYIKGKHKEASEKADLTHEDILREIKEIVMLDISNVVNLKTIEKKHVNRVVDEEATKDLLKRRPNSTAKKYKDEEVSYYEQELVFSDFDELTERQRRSIKSVKQGRFGIEIEFHSKDRFFEMINKHIGFYEVDNKQKAPQINYDSLSVDVLKTIWDARKGT